MAVFLRRVLAFFILFALCGQALPAHAFADDADKAANRTFIEAIGLIRRASSTYDTREAVRLLRGADGLLKKIVNDYPESSLAVQISTNQFVGDFDPLEFRSRIRSLSCERGSYVEDFLSEYGIASTTGPLTEACFLYRIEALLSAIEHPIAAARWDWLSLAIAYHAHNQPERAREIILPFMAALTKKLSPSDTQDSLLFLARAMDMTDEHDQADKIIQRIGDCSGRMTVIGDRMRAALWDNRMQDARNAADDLVSYVRDNQCNWQMAATATALFQTGREDEAKKIYTNLLAEQYAGMKDEDKRENTPPELAIAAAFIGEPAQALNMLRLVMDQNGWAVPAAMQALGGRGEFDVAQQFIESMKDVDGQAFSYAALIDTALRDGDKKKASTLMTKLTALRASANQPAEQSTLLAMRARAEKMLYKDERWRTTLQSALNTADLVDENTKRSVALPLISTLVYIKTGHPVLD